MQIGRQWCFDFQSLLSEGVSEPQTSGMECLTI